jgi:drug/metabolite transporter (DMT)-like permease
MNIVAPSSEASVPTLFTPRVLVPLALVGLYLLWGSTYLAIRIGLVSYPPFLMAAIRFLIASALMFGVVRWRGMAMPTARQWMNCAIVGVMLLGFGNGLVCYAELTVASGISAVAVASMPLFAAVAAGFYRQWPNRLEWIGLLVGFAGVVVLNFGGDLRAAPLGALALITAAASWAFGSVWGRHQNMPHPVVSTAAQMLCGSVALALAGWLTGERITAVPTLDATLALGYLVVAGSLLGFSAYIYLLHRVRPALATSYAYINPPVAVLIGVALGGESVRSMDIAGMAIILAGVLTITLAKDKR